MKKILALLLAVTMLLALCVGCGQKPEPDPSADNDVSTGTSVDENPVEPDESDEEPVESTDDTDTTESTESTEESTDTTDVSDDTTAADNDTTTAADKTTTKASADKTEKTTTKASADKTEKTTTKASAGKTEKTTTKSSAKTEKTTTKSSAKTEKTTTKTSTKTNSTTTVTTTKTTTTKVTTTTTTRFTPGFNTTSKTGSGGITTTTKNQNNGYVFDPGDEWELYWNDEFDGSTLDTTKWTYESGVTAIYVEKQENVTVQGGNLILTARHADPSSNKGRSFTTGAVNSGDKFSFQYGRLEFRARLPYGEGVHPGLWTMGDYYRTTSDELGWPRCGEIDVMELVGAGSEADRYTESYNRRTTCNLHWGANRDAHEEIGTTSYFIQDGSLADEYHVYACEWDEDSITFYFDDIKISETKLDDPEMGDAFKQPHWIIMSFSLDSKGQHVADETTPLPQSMYVDYVRVYKQK